MHLKTEIYKSRHTKNDFKNIYFLNLSDHITKKKLKHIINAFYNVLVLAKHYFDYKSVGVSSEPA